MTIQSQPSTVHFSRWFVLITVVFVTCLITVNITAVKLVSVFVRVGVSYSLGKGFGAK